METASPLKLGQHRSRASSHLQSILAFCAQQRPSKVLYACLSAMILASGARALTEPLSSRSMLAFCVNAHTLFAVSLCTLLFVRYRSSIQHSDHVSHIHSRALCRELSRIVYCFIYAVIGVRQSIAILNSVWHGVPLDFNIMDQRFRGPDSRAFLPHDDFQLFIASALLALIFARVLAFRMWQRKEMSSRSNDRN
jgi:hypothetical protein